MLVNQLTYWGSLPCGRGRTVVVAAVGGSGAVVTINGTDDSVVVLGAKKNWMNHI